MIIMQKTTVAWTMAVVGGSSGKWSDAEYPRRKPRSTGRRLERRVRENYTRLRA